MTRRQPVIEPGAMLDGPMANHTLAIAWPLGPTYNEWVKSDGIRAWVQYKLKSAAFHIETLHRVGEAHGYSRLVGVEMALDAALASLCGAFDASTGGIIHAAQRYFGQGKELNGLPWEPVQPFEYSWNKCLARVVPHLRKEDLAWHLDSVVTDVATALSKADDQPLGWLTELQRLRNHTIHQESLARHIDVGIGRGHDRTEWSLTVGARTHKDGTREDGRAERPVAYLWRAHEHLTQLTNRMVDLADHINPHDVPIARPSQSSTAHAPAAREGLAAGAESFSGPDSVAPG